MTHLKLLLGNGIVAATTNEEHFGYAVFGATNALTLAGVKHVFECTHNTKEEVHLNIKLI